MTKCDRAGLQIMIGFGLPCEKKFFKNGLQSAMGLQNSTDYIVIKYSNFIFILFYFCKKRLNHMSLFFLLI